MGMAAVGDEGDEGGEEMRERRVGMDRIWRNGGWVGGLGFWFFQESINRWMGA